MEQTTEIAEINETLVTTETTEIHVTTETPETTETHIICPYCNKEQITLISVIVCEADNLKWYKCSVTKNCKLFQIKNI